MIGFPYDDLDGWRGPYPPQVFISQFQKVADGFDQAIDALQRARETEPGGKALSKQQEESFRAEFRVAQACAIHFRTTANQAQFVLGRRKLEAAKTAPEASGLIADLESLLRSEVSLAKRLFEIQRSDSRIGFEATNHYYYTPIDLMEKVLNCHDLLDHWLPQQRTARRPTTASP